MNNMKPVTPAEAKSKKGDDIPDFVIESFNRLIIEGLSGDYSIVTQDAAINLILSLAPAGTTREEIFKNKWLDIETRYENAGWKVFYDKPGYNETYKAFYNFRAAGPN